MPFQAWAQDLAYNYLGQTTVSGVSAATIMVPDYVVPANSLTPGSKIRATIYGNASTASSSPGTATFGIKWGGIGGTTITVGAPALTLVASATNVPFVLTWLIVCTALLSSGGTLFCQGMFTAGAALFAAPSFSVMPNNPSANASLSFTASENLSFFVTPSVTTQSWTSNLEVLDG